MSRLARDSRLIVPPLPPCHVPRPRLVAALDRATEAPLALVSAGPGAGKTVLLTEWAQQTPDRVVWVTPSPADAKPMRFWRLLAAAGVKPQRRAPRTPVRPGPVRPVAR
jgi:LuxR family transcriptional regulator, maltose regulon positive regulatory protein